MFTYGDFSPLDPTAIERSVSTNERLVFSKEEIDATLVAEGYHTIRGVDDVKFVVIEEQFSDRLTGETTTVKILVAPGPRVGTARGHQGFGPAADRKTTC